MNIKTPIAQKKGQNGEKIFAIALFLTLVIAAAVAWFVLGQKAEDTNKTFKDAHERILQTVNETVARMLSDIDSISATYALTPTRSEPSADDPIGSMVLHFGVFDASENAIQPAGATVLAPRSPALQSAKNSPYPHDLLFSRSPFTGEKAILATAALDSPEGTSVLVMELENAAFVKGLLPEDPERNDILLVVAQDGSVIMANQETPAIMNLNQWIETANAKDTSAEPLYIPIRDRIASLLIYESADGDFRLAISPIASTDWTLAQIEYIK